MLKMNAGRQSYNWPLFFTITFSQTELTFISARPGISPVTPSNLKKLRLEGLFNIQVTSISKRIAWQYKAMEISLIGRNLVNDSMLKPGYCYMPLNFYARIICRL